MGNCLDKSDTITLAARRKRKSNNTSMSIDNPKISLRNFRKKAKIGSEKEDTGKNYAMKVMRRSMKYKKDTHDIKSERVILGKMRYPFVVSLHYAFQQDYILYLILELANGGDLFNHIQKTKGLPEDHCKFYAAEILCGLDFLHKNGIVYRNLKPEDVLLDKDGHIKLSDFGLARSLEEITTTFCGDPYYMAPEIITGDKQTYAIDLWSYGILLYEMIAGEAPFKGDSPKGILKSVLTSTISMPDKFSEDARDLICRLLSPNPKDRIGSKDIDEIKTHDFFKCIDWDRIEDMKYPVPHIPSVVSDSDVCNLDMLDHHGTVVDKTFNQSKCNITDANISNFYFNVHDCFDH
ncbi:unnamed protein product [Moneuplotes crassus]|uniref:Uncharacterized protein n=2 Tax=Euplotes crassus TaxID=5936 RepID=A0AAD1UPL0_EUPCR|nr:unnamed protein product [Moneuplotes crassus]